MACAFHFRISSTFGEALEKPPYRAMPPLLGQIKGTPTIRAFVPRRGSSRNAKQALDYEQAREVKDLMRLVSNGVLTVFPSSFQSHMSKLRRL